MAAVPLTAFICKVASRCNLDCDYCYVYRHADQSWRHQPVRMSLETAAQLGRRINEHARAHDLRSVNVILHGGEPLVLGVAYLGQLCGAIRRHAPDVEVVLHGQTNGVLYDERVFEFCQAWDITFGLSLDGPRGANDRHRLDHAGRSSIDRVERALTLLSSDEGRKLWGGFLSVIDLANDPLEVYAYLSGFRPPSIDFLLPLAHYDLLPPGKEPSLATTPYADWLLRIFEVWYRERPQPVKIRRFRDIISQLLGVPRTSEEWGLQPVDFIVVETDGEIQAVDTLKVTYPGACRLGLDIYRHSFDDALASPLVLERMESWQSLSETCRRCDLVRVCGGGYFPHRWSRANGFKNPSVYCADLMKLIRAITRVVVDDLQRLQSPPDPQPELCPAPGP